MTLQSGQPCNYIVSATVLPTAAECLAIHGPRSGPWPQLCAHSREAAARQQFRPFPDNWEPISSIFGATETVFGPFNENAGLWTESAFGNAVLGGQERRPKRRLRPKSGVSIKHA